MRHSSVLLPPQVCDAHIRLRSGKPEADVSEMRRITISSRREFVSNNVSTNLFRTLLHNPELALIKTR